MQDSDTITKQMMTLAALAATGATPRPSGETQAAQAQRILDGINAQLKNPDLATQAAWTALWVGLTQDRANMAYIAGLSVPPMGGPNYYVIVLRGTVGGSPIDTAEDMDVGTMFPFPDGGTPPSGPVGQISQGAMKAFTEIVMGTDLIARVQEYALTVGVPPIPMPSIFFVTGHSLGGTLATTVGLHLAARFWIPLTPSFNVYTFAAPTAGDAGFAAWFDQKFPTAVAVYNYYDLVPNAWASLQSIYDAPLRDPFYPQPPGPTASITNELGILISNIAKDTNGHTYVQPTRQPALNHPMIASLPYDAPYDGYSTLQKFELQVGFQHANNTYLTLLGAPTLPALAPVVMSLSPTSGPAGGGTSVTLTPATGTSFAADSVVDFGVVPAPSVTLNSDGTLTAVAPPGVGVVDVTVTNMYGTSPVVPNLTAPTFSDQFTFTGSALASPATQA